jgi:hypothetical protein
LFCIFPKKFIRGNAATNNTPNEGGKFYRGKVKEVETFNYFVEKCNPFQKRRDWELNLSSF